MKQIENENNIDEYFLLREIEYKSDLIEHNLIKRELDGIGSFSFKINDVVIGGCFREPYQKYPTCFIFNENLSNEVINKLRPILVKWEKDSKEHYDKNRKNRIEKDNKLILKAIKSL